MNLRICGPLQAEQVLAFEQRRRRGGRRGGCCANQEPNGERERDRAHAELFPVDLRGDDESHEACSLRTPRQALALFVSRTGAFRSGGILAGGHSAGVTRMARVDRRDFMSLAGLFGLTLPL